MKNVKYMILSVEWQCVFILLSLSFETLCIDIWVLPQLWRLDADFSPPRLPFFHSLCDI
jgi:hypothetical protein